MSEKFLQMATIESAFVPVDMGAGANDGDWISLENYRRALVVLFGAIGTAGQDPIFTLRQAQDVAGTNAKALNFTTIYSKVGATALSGVTAWTRTTQTAANTYTDATSAENEKFIAVEVDAADLDVDGGFDCIQFQIPDVGAAAQIGCGFVILFDPRYPQGSMQSALA